MAIPARATGYGNNSTAQNVFRLAFSTALSAAPAYEAYDGATFPAVGVAVTTANTIFAGTAGNGNIPMLSLVDTNSAPTSAWKPGSATGGSASPNRMKGQTNYVTAGNTPGAGGFIHWNEVLEVPSDATTSSTMAIDLLVRYSYTGAAPTLTWTFNDFGAGGTEGTPVWTTLTPGTHGVRHAKSGATSGAGYPATIPASSTQDTVEGWVTT
jgi:hypothetical protein